MSTGSFIEEDRLAISVPLKPGWDAALTYDLLEESGDGRPRGIFVGRDALVGPLVNALSQPHQRGTYLVSGYRGVGKTSLIIEAMLRARAKLTSIDWTLLPVILNVSEVSASLTSAGDATQAELSIDARRLLTALLRALRNRLEGSKDEPIKAVAAKVYESYEKAQASKFTQTRSLKDEAAIAITQERSRVFQISNVMALVAGLFVVAALFTEATVLVGAISQLHAVAAGLVGLAVLSFASSRIVKRTRSRSDVGSREIVFDNSLHQLESELKDILEKLSRARLRTVIVLEELDKIDDDQGRQLESVIRYFKNLFTQAPALFFFVTDKGYYDAVGDRIDAARSNGSYAIEHTFFTHRIFVVRPEIDECLNYLREILLTEQGRADVDAITKSSELRARPIGQMSPLERCLRVLLFRSQAHFFDLKNQVRQFVRVDGEHATLEFDDALISKSDQALAAFQFLVEQKVHTYRFGGGRDYANEALRSCLFAVFERLGAQESRDIQTLYPAAGYIGERLSLSERGRIIEALDTLVEDLERGKALSRHIEEGSWKFSWSKIDPAISFAPAVRLAPHEQTLVNQLMRMSATARAWATAPRLRPLLGGADAAVAAARLQNDLSRQAEVISGSQTAMASEEADRALATAQKQIAEIIEPLITAHATQLARDSSLSIVPLSSSTPPTLYRVSGEEQKDELVLLHYSVFGAPASDLRQFADQRIEKAAVVRVVADVSDRPSDESSTDPFVESPFEPRVRPSAWPASSWTRGWSPSGWRWIGDPARSMNSTSPSCGQARRMSQTCPKGMKPSFRKNSRC